MATCDYLNNLLLHSLTEERVKTPELMEKIQTVLEESSNPFIVTLQLFGNANQFPRTESLSFAVVEAIEAVKEKLEPAVINTCLDDNTKHVAFHFFHDKSIMSIKKVIAIYELVKSNHMFINPLKRLLDKRDYKTAGQLACELKMFKEFNFFDLLFPLYLLDLMTIFEKYLKNATQLRFGTIKFFDRLLDPPLKPNIKCMKLMKGYGMTNFNNEKLEEIAVHKLITRLLTLYNFDVSTVAPNYYILRQTKKLGVPLQSNLNVRRTSVDACGHQMQRLTIYDNVNLQMDLIKNFVDSFQFQEARKIVDFFKIPVQVLPRSLNHFMENEIACKRSKQDNDRMFPLPLANNLVPIVIVAPPSPPEQQEDWVEEHVVPEEIYELNLDPSKIVMVDTINTCLDMLRDMTNVQKIAFDTIHTTTDEVSILQIATHDKVYIIDISGLQASMLNSILWKMLGSRLFNNECIIKLGFDLSRNIEMLQKTKIRLNLPLDSSYRDLQKIGLTVFKVPEFKYPHHEAETQTLGLSKLTKLCFGKELDKRYQLSNWALRPLRPAQLTHAALDAFVLIEIHALILNELNKIGMGEDKLKNMFFK